MAKNLSYKKRTFSLFKFNETKTLSYSKSLVIGQIKAPQPKSCYYAFHAEIKAAASKAGNKSKFLGGFFALVPSCLNVLNDRQC